MSTDQIADNQRYHFLHRLKSLQSLCSSENPKYPDALVFIPGIDGRQNKGSQMILKYLFQGSVGRELYEGILDTQFEALEEIVLVIQESSVSVFWSSEAKALIGPMLKFCSYLIEYGPTIEEENEVDTFQERKCVDFKRMMLESVKEGGVVGLPVPLGFDDVLDTETWPLLQSFAIDSMLAPTGFFTTYYVAIDITETLDIIFRTVDAFYVDKAVSMLQTAIIPHMNQTLDNFNTHYHHSVDNRKDITADEVATQLQMLFEFGELDASFAVDPVLKPAVYMGPQFHAIGNTLSSKWKTEVVGDNLSSVVEGCEPSTGLRWCRTYILRRGKYIPEVVNLDALVQDESHFQKELNLDDDDTNERKRGDDDFNGEETKASSGISQFNQEISKLPNISEDVDLLERLYTKLSMCVRWAVRQAFEEYDDVLDAGGAVQNMLQDLMSRPLGNDDKLSRHHDHKLAALWDTTLERSQQLQVHMDCMNALGQVVKIEDVDDMGGQCWTYIRVSVNNIELTSSSKTVFVAVGDTYLFSSGFTSLVTEHDLINKNKNKKDKLIALDTYGYFQDSYCVTHAIPLYRCFLSAGVEESMGRQFMSASRNIHMMKSIGLGAYLDTIMSHSGGFAILSDHPCCPVLHANDLRLYSNGFVIETLDNSFLPVCLSIVKHVKSVHTIDISDAYYEALNSMNFALSKKNDVNLPEGILMVFELKQFDNDESSRDDIVENDDTSNKYLQYNPFSKMLPNMSPVNYVALIVPSTSRYNGIFNQATFAWKSTMRMYDIPDVRGGSSSLPPAVQYAFLASIDKRNLSQENITSEVGGDLFRKHINSVDADDVISVSKHIPGSHYVTMRNTFLAAEHYCLLKNEDNVDDEADKRRVQGQSSKQIIVVCGHAGSGVLNICAQLKNRISGLILTNLQGTVDMQATNSSKALVDTVIFDMSRLGEDAESSLLIGSLARDIGTQNSSRVVVGIISSPLSHIPLHDLLENILAIPHCSVVYAMAAIGVSSAVSQSESQISFSGLGYELWTSTAKELLQMFETIIFIEDNKDGNSKSGLKDFFSCQADVNSNAFTQRVTQHNLWLDVSILDQIVDRLTAKDVKKFSNRYNSIVIRKSNAVKQLPSLGVVSVPLRAAQQSCTAWDIERLIACLQSLFPSAVLSNTYDHKTWQSFVPNMTDDSTGITRAIELAKLKYCYDLQTKAGKVEFDKKMEEINRRMQSTRKGNKTSTKLDSLAFHAILYLSNVRKIVLIEASSGIILIRPYEGDVISTSTSMCSMQVNTLYVTGVFDAMDKEIVSDMFQLCYPYHIQERKELTFCDLSSALLHEISAKHIDIPLPTGWWYNGSIYLDVHGNTKFQRPDIELIADIYLSQKNSELMEYNAMINKFKKVLV